MTLTFLLDSLSAASAGTSSGAGAERPPSTEVPAPPARKAYASGLAPDEISKALRMRRHGVSYRHIAVTFGIHWDTLRRAIDPEWREKRNAQIAAAKRRHKRSYVARSPDGLRFDDHRSLTRAVPAETLADREHRLMLPPRDLTASICGDPPPGYSALDRRRA